MALYLYSERVGDDDVQAHNTHGKNNFPGKHQRMQYWSTVLNEPEIALADEKKDHQEVTKDVMNRKFSFKLPSKEVNNSGGSREKPPKNMLNVNKRDAEKSRNHMHQCHLCSAIIKRRHDLKQHINAVHRRLRPHVCSECGFKFGYSSSLSKQIRAVHRKEKKFRCEHCSQMFSQRGNLNRHKLRKKECRE